MSELRPTEILLSTEQIQKRVAEMAREIRRTVAAHGIVSFFFNAALLALTINIAASAI